MKNKRARNQVNLTREKFDELYPGRHRLGGLVVYPPALPGCSEIVSYKIIAMGNTTIQLQRSSIA